MKRGLGSSTSEQLAKHAKRMRALHFQAARNCPICKKLRASILMHIALKHKLTMNQAVEVLNGAK